MKKLFVLVLSAGLFTTATSQKVYVQGGVNLANISTSNSGATQKSNLLTTFNAGIMARSNDAEPIALEAGLLLEGKGSKADTYTTSSTEDNYIKTKFNPLYLQLPVNLIVRLPLQSSSNIFFNAGPYVAMGIGGKAKTETKIMGNVTKSSHDIEFNNDNPSTNQQEDASFNKLKRFDYGVNVGGGFDLNSVILKVNYGLGLAKINSTQTDNSDNNKNKYRTVSISVGIPLAKR
jgi:hypothetical protein